VTYQNGQFPPQKRVAPVSDVIHAACIGSRYVADTGAETDGVVFLCPSLGVRKLFILKTPTSQRSNMHRVRTIVLMTVNLSDSTVQIVQYEQVEQNNDGLPGPCKHGCRVSEAECVDSCSEACGKGDSNGASSGEQVALATRPRRVQLSVAPQD